MVKIDRLQVNTFDGTLVCGGVALERLGQAGDETITHANQFYPCRDADGVEVQQPGEKEKIQAVSDQFKRFQMMNFNEHHHCLRGTHLKTQGVNILLSVPDPSDLS